MATARKTTKPAQPTEPDAEAKPAAEPETARADDAASPTGEENRYADQAQQVAADARALAETTRRQVDDLTARRAALTAVPFTRDDAAIADNARRIPMALGDLTRSLQALAGAASDLTAAALR